MNSMEKKDYASLEKRICELEAQVHLYRDYDPLTGLWNKDTFYKNAQELLKQHPGTLFQIFFIDIERFKLVNDFYGTEQGNHLLQYAAAELKQRLMGENCMLARIGADTFALIKPYGSAEEEGKTICAVQEIFVSYPLDMEINAAVGLYMIADQNISVSRMCDRAGLAARSVKGNYANHAARYRNDMRNILVEEHELLNGVEQALLEGQFQVYIQPKCNMRTGKITGGEALVRWIHPQKGMIPPNDFIPIFEKNGFIKKLDRYVWEEIAGWLSRRKEQGLSLIPVSVNISRIDVFGADLGAVFGSLIEKYGLEAKWMELEITESAYINRVEEVISVVEGLMERGFTVLMDDFGSGYSSLNILKDISIDVLKLDLKFLDNRQKKSKNILESVVRMARWMNLRVIAEGVEEKEQVDFLLGIGCTYAQGYYYYRPMPLREFEGLLRRPESVDFQDYYRHGEKESSLIHMREFLSEDILSEVVLSNILGMVALYSYDGAQLRVIRGNMKYYQTMHAGISYHTDVSSRATDLIYEKDRPELFRALEEAKQVGDCGSAATVRRYLEQEDRMVWLQIRLFFLSETNGKGIYYASISDVSDYMRLVEEARISGEGFRIAIESSQDTIFELDIETRTAKYAIQSKELFGLEENWTDAPEGFIRQGSVLQEYEADFREMYYAIYRGEEQSGCTIQAALADGSIVWNRITLTSIRDGSGKPVKAVGLVRNVTREKELESKVRHANG